MLLPADVKVEVGFGSTMFTASPTWTDISPYVRSITTHRGRPSIEGRFTAGTASVVLDNRDGRFNPDNTQGAYYPNVKIGVPFRITRTVSDTTYPIFYGGARAWPPTYPRSQDSTVTVPLVDAFYNLQLEDLALESYSAQSTVARLGAVLDDVSWPAALRDFDVALATVQATDFAQPFDGGEQPALPHLLDVAESEVGVLFMSADGKVTFKNRVANSGAASKFTFTDSHITHIDLDYSDKFLWNDIRIAREDGAQVVVTDASSIAAHGRRVLTKDVMPMGSDPEALSVGSWLASIFAEQRVRVEQLTVKPLASNGALLATVLGLELRDMVTVQHTPPGGDAIDQVCAVEEIRHTITPRDWVTTLSVAPLSSLEQQDFWILDTSELDDTTVLA